MSVRAVRGFSVFILLLFSLIGLTGAALAAGEARSVVTTQNSDYFGFDLRSEQNFSLEQCKTACLGDSSCRAFTYNTKAKWCFLKSDYNQLKPFAGAVAGKVVSVSGEPDIGAPAELGFFPSWMADEARLLRQNLTNGKVAVGESGLAFLTDAAEQAMLTGDARTAMNSYTAAVVISPDDSALWTGLARATLARAAGQWRRDRPVPAQRHLGGLERLQHVAHRRRAGRCAERHGGRARPPRLFQAGTARLRGEPGAGQFGRGQGGF